MSKDPTTKQWGKALPWAKRVRELDTEIEYLKAELQAYKEQQTEDIQRLAEWQKLIVALSRALSHYAALSPLEIVLLQRARDVKGLPLRQQEGK